MSFNRTPVVFSRTFAMPNHETFLLPPVSALLDRLLYGIVVDPFARNSNRGTITNDLSPTTSAQFHMKAEEFVLNHVSDLSVDVVLFDPPYSPRQITESYQSVGLKCTTQDTQNARLYKTVKDGLDRMLKYGGLAICCGWNSMGFGISRGYVLEELLLVPHGAAHNDTIVTVERKKCL